jgi:hypothetical protein
MRLNVTACFGYYDKAEGSCVGWSRGEAQDKLPCSIYQYCRAFAFYLKGRGQEVTDYIESWEDKDGQVHHQPTMGRAAFALFCQELVSESNQTFEESEGSLRPAPVSGLPPPPKSDEEEDGAMPPVKKIVRRGPYKTRKARMDYIAQLTSVFIDGLYEQIDPWRRCALDAAPAYGQIFLSSVKKGRYLSLYVRGARRSSTVVVIRYHTLRRALVVEVDIARDDFLRLVPYEIKRFKKKTHPGKRFQTMVVDLKDKDDVLIAAGVIGRAIEEGLIPMPPKLE